MEYSMKVKHLKKWLDNFIDEAEVEHILDLDDNVYLCITLEGKPLGATLDLSLEELPKEETKVAQASIDQTIGADRIEEYERWLDEDSPLSEEEQHA